jgi:predicted phosphodiesterase
MKITFISDTHNKHAQVTSSLPGGDLLIHAGDMSSMGYKHEIQQFLKWFNGLDNYTHKIFIAGNHDWGFQNDPKMCQEQLEFYNKVTYLQDNLEVIGDDFDFAAGCEFGLLHPLRFDSTTREKFLTEAHTTHVERGGKKGLVPPTDNHFG